MKQPAITDAFHYVLASSVFSEGTRKSVVDAAFDVLSSRRYVFDVEATCKTLDLNMIKPS